MSPRERGQTAEGFRRQLLTRLRNQAIQDGVPPLRLQQRIAFERLLARIPTDSAWMLKGGFALQFRYGLLTRPTKDVDLRAADTASESLALLRQFVASHDLPDHFAFQLGPNAQEMPGAPGGSVRVRVAAQVAGQDFAVFHIDLSSGDAVVGDSDTLSGSNLLEFAGIPPIAFPVYPVIQHLSEKLHAYTIPRTQGNTRVKDLVDLIIIAASERIEADRLEISVRVTFSVRATHAVPSKLPEPPAFWAQSFSIIASEAHIIPITNLRDGHAFAAHFWNPFLAGNVAHQAWLPTNATWV